MNEPCDLVMVEEDIGSDKTLDAADGGAFEECAGYKSRFWVSHRGRDPEK